MPPLAARSVQDGAKSGVFFWHLTFENATILERKAEHVAGRRIRHRIEPHDCRRPAKPLQTIANTTQVPITPVETADAGQRSALRNIGHTTESEMQRMLRKHWFYGIGIATLLLTTLVSGQMRTGPASLDDVVVELRGIRADLAETSSASVRSQLLVARLQLQEQRIYGIMRQLADVQNQIAGARQQAQGPEQARMQQLIQDLGNQEADLNHQLTMEQGRWSEFSDRLDALERSLPR
jgi:hypothetical protein